MVTELTVREAVGEDLPAIVSMGKKFLASGPYKDQISSPDNAMSLALAVLKNVNGHIFVADDGTGPKTGPKGVFAFIVFPHYFSGELTAAELIWYVEPEYRQGGVALKLLAAAEKYAKDLGAVRMQLTAPTEELGKLYKYCGGYAKVEVGYQRRL